MKVEESDLRDLLTDEAAKERRAYKRATLPVFVIMLMGLVWLTFSAYSVVRLDAQIKEKQTELNRLQNDIRAAEETLKSIAAGKPNKLAQRALGEMGNLELRINRPGSDISNFQVNDADACSKACQNDIRCKAITFVKHPANPPANPRGICWLKDSVPPMLPSAGMVSAVKMFQQ